MSLSETLANPAHFEYILLQKGSRLWSVHAADTSLIFTKLGVVFLSEMHKSSGSSKPRRKAEDLDVGINQRNPVF
jgi:hypothetical protein